jgi:hypothetical protein
VHVFRSTQDGIHRAGLDAFGAADAFIFPDDGNASGLFHPVFCVQWLRFHIEQIGQCFDGGLTSRGTPVDRIAVGNGFGIGTATGKPALATLGLWQQRVDLFHEWVAFNPESLRGKTEQAAKYQGEAKQNQNGDNDACPHKNASPLNADQAGKAQKRQ